MQLPNIFVHHVFFFLKDKNEENQQQLIEGLNKLSKAPIIKQSHIGVKADTHRDVVDRSYDVSWLVFFNSADEQESYQTDPIHLEFVETCKQLWTKVIIYDSINA